MPILQQFFKDCCKMGESYTYGVRISENADISEMGKYKVYKLKVTTQASKPYNEYRPGSLKEHIEKNMV